jgi:shikimate kinase
MAAGKSTIGRKLAERLELPFQDTDELVEVQFGCPVAEIFLRYGEAEFRRIEREAIGSLLDLDAHVISIGGGAFVDPATRDTLNRVLRTVWLDAPFELVAQRLEQCSTRPLAEGKTSSQLRNLWDERRKYYAEAQFRISAEGNPEEVVERILTALRV